MMNHIERSHLEEYGTEPCAIAEVPQVVTLIGAFSDCIDGYAIMGTCDNGLKIAVSKRDDNTVKILNATKQDKKKFQITNIKYRKEDRWANCIKAILQEVVSSGFVLPGMNITIQGESAICDNPSFSSYAFIGMLFALEGLLGISFTKEEKKKMAFSSNRFSQAFQARLRDLITLLYSKEDNLMFFDLSNHSYEFLEYPKKDNVSSLLISTAIPYTILTPELEEFRQEANEVVGLIRKKLPKTMSIKNLNEKNIRQILNISSEQKKGQLRFLVEDSECALNGWKALKNGDMELFGKNMNLQEKGLEMNAELTSPEIDWIVKRGSEMKKLYGICQIYTGVAGTLFALIDSSVDFPYTSQLEEYERIFGFHANVCPYVPYGSARSMRRDEYSTCQ